MKHASITILAGIGMMLGLVLLFVGADAAVGLLVFGGLARNLAVTATYLIISAVGVFIIFLCARWGRRFNQRAMAWLYMIAAIGLLGLGVYMFSRLGSSIPTPSQAWLAGMAMSRARFLGQYPQIDDALVTQARILLAVWAGLFVLGAALFGLIGRKWMTRKEVV